MAWCYYCKTYTVNGQCPKCGRIYQDPNKSYDFYGKEKPSSGSGSAGISVSHDGWKGFWLGFAINFGAIIITVKRNRRMLAGAIVGTIANTILITNIVTTIVFAYLHYAGVAGY